MFKAAGPLRAQAAIGGDNVFARLAKVGRKVLRRVLQRKELEPTVPEILKPTWSLRSQTVKVDEKATRLIGGLFPKQLVKTQAAELRRQAALRLIRDARKVPVLTFVGLSLGAALDQNKGAHTDDALCSGIRDLFQQHGGKEREVEFKGHHFSLQSLQLGQLIGQGCNAAIFEARPVETDLDEAEEDAREKGEDASADVENSVDLLPENVESCTEQSSDETSPKLVKGDNLSTVGERTDDEDDDFIIISEEKTGEESLEDDEEDDFIILSEEEEEMGEEENLDNWVLYRVSSASGSSASMSDVTDDSDTDDSDIFILAGDQEGLQSLPDMSWDFSWATSGDSLSQMDVGEELDHDSSHTQSEGSATDSASVSCLSSLSEELSDGTSVTTGDPEPAPNIGEGGEFPLAVKMMYNYYVESRDDRILSAMAKETVPALTRLTQTPDWQSSHMSAMKQLPPHPNVVTMYDVFVDQTPDLPEGSEWYPCALPPRLNKDGGFGRNATMFLVMKRYSMTLREFLAVHSVDTRSRCLLLAQLLEGTVHLGRHGIAHRDLKSDNVLLDLSQGTDCPHLAISDFGCCLADQHYHLMLPYPTPDTDKGGNSALMAPEIKRATPGPHTMLDYSKADLWAVGTLAYEIFGDGNPFCQGLDSGTYCEQELPKLPDGTPEVVVNLVEGMLKRNPSERLSAATAATCLELFLWGPPEVRPINKQDALSSSSPLWKCKEIAYWLERLTMETVCQRVFGGDVSRLDLQIKSTFLSRISQQDILGVASYSA
ncbi:hypothetical protein ACOMHN_028989 [Nucella lapillus]